MTTVTITTPAGDKGDSIVLPDSIFGVQANIALMHQVVVAQLAAARQGTHKYEEPRRGLRWRQEAVPPEGNRPRPSGFDPFAAVRRRRYLARTRPAPVPAAHPEEDEGRRSARCPLRSGPRRKHPRAVVPGRGLQAVDEGRDQARSPNVSTAKNVLVVIAREDEAGWKSLRNADNVHLIASDQLNTYDVLISDDVVFTEQSLNDFLVFARVQAAVIETELEEARLASKKRSKRSSSRKFSKRPSRRHRRGVRGRARRGRRRRVRSRSRRCR